jgi:CAAX prenyl protease-like protein
VRSAWIAALWMGPFLLLPELQRPAPSEGFDAALFGPGREALALAVRLVGFAGVTPFMEELFVRSFLIRLVDVIDGDMNFRKLPIGRFTWRSFIVTVVWFTFTHVSWEWVAAWQASLQPWLYRRGFIGAVIVAHAVASRALARRRPQARRLAHLPLTAPRAALRRRARASGRRCGGRGGRAGRAR